MLAGAAFLSLAIWTVLLWLRGGFWRADQRLETLAMPDRESWPDVVAVIPARNEADGVGRAVASLLSQDYPGPLSIVVVDDNSDDGTADVARAAAEAAGAPERLTVIQGAPLEPDWTGKMWAVRQGVEAADRIVPEARYVLLTDGDIEHGPENLRRLVDKAEWGGLDLVSLMVMLRCDSFWEKLLIPAFVFFFQKLYPFPWVNDESRETAGAAGGCMLVRRQALVRIGGIESIRDQVIDDCALAEKIKEDGGIWLGLTDHAFSLRPYDTLGEIWRMVARTAFVQLDHSALQLLGTVAGMAAIYVAPPLATVMGLFVQDLTAVLAGGLAWGIMARAYAPTLALYGRPAWTGIFLPFTALLYTLMTVDSARRHWRGRGGGWKGRTYP